VLGGSPEFMPSQVTGRGLISGDGTLEYQGTLPEDGSSEQERNDKMSEFISNYLEWYDGNRAKNIPLLPVDELYEATYKKFSHLPEEQGVLPLGYRINDISAYGIDLKEHYCVSVSDVSGKGIANYINNVAYACNQLDYETLCVKINSNIVGVEMDYMDLICRNYDDLYDLMIRLKGEFTERVKAVKAYVTDNPKGDAREYAAKNLDKLFVVIDDMGAFIDIAYNTSGRDALSPLLETFLKQGAYHGIYFVGGFPSNINSTLLYLAATKSFLSYGEGVHFEGKLASQKVFEVTLPLVEQNKSYDVTRGYHVSKAGAEWIHVPKNV
jgi:hypothetical protein